MDNFWNGFEKQAAKYRNVVGKISGKAKRGPKVSIYNSKTQKTLKKMLGRQD